MRTFACVVLVVAGALFAPGSATAQQKQQKFPTKPVRIVVGFSAGSATDITARILAPKLADAWGHPVVIENRTGAGGSVGAAIVAKATPDGHTLLLVSAAFAINAVLQPNLAFDALKDFTGVAQVGFTSGVMVVAPQLGVKTVKDFIALANERPGKILFGSAGAGSGIHITAERFRSTAGIKAVHVGFKGQPEMLVEIMSGRIHFGMPSLGPALHHIREGRLVALATLTAQRSPQLPDVPAMQEVLPTFERDASHMILAPAGTPRAIREQIARDVAQQLEAADVRQQMQAITFVPTPAGPDEVDRVLRGMIATFSRVVREAGLRAP